MLLLLSPIIASTSSPCCTCHVGTGHGLAGSYGRGSVRYGGGAKGHVFSTGHGIVGRSQAGIGSRESNLTDAP
eukprot:501894-Rhodomonas_salina.2